MRSAASWSRAAGPWTPDPWRTLRSIWRSWSLPPANPVGARAALLPGAATALPAALCRSGRLRAGRARPRTRRSRPCGPSRRAPPARRPAPTPTPSFRKGCVEPRPRPDRGRLARSHAPPPSRRRGTRPALSRRRGHPNPAQPAPRRSARARGCPPSGARYELRDENRRAPRVAEAIPPTHAGPSGLQLKDFEAGPRHGSGQSRRVDRVVVLGQLGESGLGVIGRRPAPRQGLGAAVTVHRTVDRDHQAAGPEHPRRLADHLAGGRVVQRGDVKRRVDGAVAQGQVAHVAPHLQDVWPALVVK